MNLSATPEMIQEEIEHELKRSKEVHQKSFDSIATGFGVITEEYYEVVEAFRLSKEKYPEGNIDLRVELAQLAAMCIKMVESSCGYRFGKITHKMDVSFRHNSTMESLGFIAMGYQSLNCDLYGLTNKELSSKLLEFARTCKAAILSCCVYQD